MEREERPCVSFLLVRDCCWMGKWSNPSEVGGERERGTCRRTTQCLLLFSPLMYELEAASYLWCTFQGINESLFSETEREVEWMMEEERKSKEACKGRWRVLVGAHTHIFFLSFFCLREVQIAELFLGRTLSTGFSVSKVSADVLVRSAKVLGAKWSLYMRWFSWTLSKQRWLDWKMSSKKLNLTIYGSHDWSLTI